MKQPFRKTPTEVEQQLLEILLELLLLVGRMRMRWGAVMEPCETLIEIELASDGTGTLLGAVFGQRQKVEQVRVDCSSAQGLHVSARRQAPHEIGN